MALRVLLNLSSAERNQKSMWAESKVREFLLGCAAASSPFQLRAPAISMLHNLAQSKANKAVMLNDHKVRIVLMDGAASTVPVDTREQAHEALMFLLKFYEFPSGWEDA